MLKKLTSVTMILVLCCTLCVGAFSVSAAETNSTSSGTVPPATVGTVPPATVGTVPPATVGTVPPATVGTVPPATVGTVPPATVGTVPPATAGTEPPATVGTVPPATAGTEPPATVGTVPPTIEGTVPLTTDETVPVAALLEQLNAAADDKAFEQILAAASSEDLQALTEEQIALFSETRQAMVYSALAQHLHHFVMSENPSFDDAVCAVETAFDRTLEALTETQIEEIFARLEAIEPEPVPPVCIDDSSEPPVESDIIRPTVSFTHVAPFGAPAVGGR